MPNPAQPTLPVPAGFQRLDGTERRRGRNSTLLGPADPKEAVDITIVVRRRLGGLPMPDIGHWQKTPLAQRKSLSVDEFAKRYGAAQADLDAVSAFVTAAGMKLVDVNAAWRTVRATGTVSQINSAFAVELARYDSPSPPSGRPKLAGQTAAPARQIHRGLEGFTYVPQSLAGIIVGVFGLDNRKVTGRNTVPANTTMLTAVQVCQLYGWPTGPIPGQTIGILSAGGLDPNDIELYYQSLNKSLYSAGFYAPGGSPVQTVPSNAVAGGFVPPSAAVGTLIVATTLNNLGPGLSDGETNMDVALASTVAQGATIAVYFFDGTANGWFNVLNEAILGQLDLSVLSSSFYFIRGDDPTTLADWGIPTSDLTQLSGVFQAATTRGPTVCVASGDSGSAWNFTDFANDVHIEDGYAHVNYPASDPYVLSCGGTSIGNISGTAPSRFAYVGSGEGNTVLQFAIGAGGALAPMASPSVQAGAIPRSLAVDPSGRFAFVANYNGNTVSQYTVGTGGALTPMPAPTVPTGSGPLSITVHPSGLYAYVANGTDGTVSQYTIGEGGALTPMQPPADSTVAAGKDPQSIAVHPSGLYAYVANNGDNTLWQYTIDAGGALTPMATPPGPTVPTGAQPNFVVVDPSGRYAYVANIAPGANTVSQYTIGANGALTPMPIATVPAGTFPDGVTVDPTGRYVYVPNDNDQTVSQYVIGPDGALTPNGVVPTGPNPWCVAVDASGRYAYVANWSGGGPSTISQYTVGAGGALTPMSPPTVSAGNGPIYIITSPGTGVGTNFDEFIWSDSIGATGGGISGGYDSKGNLFAFPVPSWQEATGIPSSLNDGHKGRGVPDVAANASAFSGYPIYTNGIGNQQAGTSAAAPLIAGLIAQVNAYLGKNVGFVNPTLYATQGSACRKIIGGTPLDGTFQNPQPRPAGNAFQGVTGYSGTQGGWDACTGWGVFDWNGFLSAINPSQPISSGEPENCKWLGYHIVNLSMYIKHLQSLPPTQRNSNEIQFYENQLAFFEQEFQEQCPGWTY
jgi:6-phosphogluconolactonase